MTTEEFTTTVLTASEGHYLTQGGETAESARVVADRIALGRNDCADNWKEITREEGDAILARQSEARKAAMAADRIPEEEGGGDE